MAFVAKAGRWLLIAGLPGLAVIVGLAVVVLDGGVLVPDAVLHWPSVVWGSVVAATGALVHLLTRCFVEKPCKP